MQVAMEDTRYDVFFRDVVKCVEALFGDSEFARYLVFVPEKHYGDEEKTDRLYHDMHTGDWWWDTQVCHVCIFKK